MSRKPTLYDAVQSFMGPIVAEYGAIVEDGRDDMPVFICLGGKDGYTVEMTLATLKKLDQANTAAFEAWCNRQARKAKGSLL